MSARKHQPYYCEENVWHLCQDPDLAPRPGHVVFISNAARACPMWHQRAGLGRPVVWDYHVILIAENPVEVWDLDTTLGSPIPLSTYLQRSFRTELPEHLWPLFRLVNPIEFIDVFASDRSHMRRANGSYRKPPPPWPCIHQPHTTPNLMQFVDMTHPFLGEVLNLTELVSRFTPPPNLVKS